MLEPDAPVVEDVTPATPVSDKGEGTTPEEVAQVLKNSGIKLPAEPKVKVEKPKVEEPAKEEPVVPVEPEKSEEKPVIPAPVNDEKTFSLDIEDVNGQTHKITAGDDLSVVLADFEPKNNGQIFQIIKQLTQLENDKSKYDADQEKATQDSAQTARIQKIEDGWSQEIKDLQVSKRIPTVTNEDDNERVKQVYQFMTDENTKRIAASRPTLNSFEDALDKLENKEARDAKVQADKDEKETARKNGGLVGGSSAPASSGRPVYKAGSARNANEAIRTLGLLK